MTRPLPGRVDRLEQLRGLVLPANFRTALEVLGSRLC